MRREVSPTPGPPLPLGTPLGSPQERAPGSPGELGPMGCWSPSPNLVSLCEGGVTQTPDHNKALDATLIIQQLPWYCFLHGPVVFGVKIGQLRIITAPSNAKTPLGAAGSLLT